MKKILLIFLLFFALSFIVFSASFSVDARNRDVILGLIKDMNRQGKTIIMVSHDPYVAKCCDRQIYL